MQSAFVPKRLITDNALIALEMFKSMKNRAISRRGSMALKLDMSKAYDRIEWAFLEGTLLKKGFDRQWTVQIMRCVTSTSFSFIINGRPHGCVQRSRGLCQGDPISPYLFIIVADALSVMVSKAVQDKHLHRIKASRSGPAISHLFFADDSLLISRATQNECLKIVEILNSYEEASGQKVNFEKSEVSFSRGVEQCRAEELASLMGVKLVRKHSKYLGVPTSYGRSKKEVFWDNLGLHSEEVEWMEREILVNCWERGSFEVCGPSHPDIFDEYLPFSKRGS